MRSFDDILKIAVERKGGAEAVEAGIMRPKSPAELAAIPDDRWLARASQGVFSAGFNWSVVENKWPGFEEAFKGFDLDACRFMDDRWFDELIQDTRIVRHGAKIQSVRDNSAFFAELRDEGGSVGKVLGGWPAEDYIGLLEMLKKRGTRLGGGTGQYFLRFMGVDSFILSRDVTARLIAEGVIDKPAASKGAMKAVQAAFDEWRAQSGRSMSEISRVLAMSI